MKVQEYGDFNIHSFYSSLTLKGSFSPLSLGEAFEGESSTSGFLLCWMATWRKILIGKNLRRRGFSIGDWCCMCWYSGEDVDHLLIHCEGA